MNIIWKLAFAWIAVMVIGMPTAHAQRGLSIKEQTKFYGISGNSPAELARQMSRKGPFSFQHRRRAWATAARTMSYQLKWRRTASRCRVVSANVRMKIVYSMPKVRGRIKSSRTRKAWKAMYGLLNRHERTHGKFYKQLARKTHRGLRRLRPARNCRQLERAAKNLVERLSEEDNRRNDRFDNRDTRNYSRMARLTRSG